MGTYEFAISNIFVKVSRKHELQAEVIVIDAICRYCRNFIQRLPRQIGAQFHGSDYRKQIINAYMWYGVYGSVGTSEL